MSKDLDPQIEIIDGYKERVRYLRIFVPYFDSSQGYKFTKWKHVESLLRNVMLEETDKYLDTLDPDTVLWSEQERLIDRYYAYVYPPTTFLTNMSLVREYFKGFEKRNGYDLTYWKKLSEENLAVELKSLPRSLLTKAVDYIALYQNFRSRPVRPESLKGMNVKKREKVLKAAGLFDYGDIFKYAFIPVSKETNDVEIITVGDSVGIKENSVWRFEVPFDIPALIKDPQTEIRRAFDSLPKKFKYSSIAVVTLDDKTVFKVALPDSGAAYVTSLDALVNRVEYFMNRYNGTNTGVENPANHIFTDWLKGIVAYKGNNKRDLNRYLKNVKNTTTSIKEQVNKEKQAQKRLRAIAQRNEVGKKFIAAKKKTSAKKKRKTKRRKR
jgi:hypothetical protein